MHQYCEPRMMMKPLNSHLLGIKRQRCINSAIKNWEQNSYGAEPARAGMSAVSARTSPINQNGQSCSSSLCTSHSLQAPSGLLAFRGCGSQAKKSWTSLLRYFWKISHHPGICYLPKIRNSFLKGTGPVSGSPWRETH